MADEGDHKIDEGTLSLVKLSGLGFELLITIFVVGAMGFGIDYMLDSKPWGLVGGIVLGCIVGFYNMIRTALSVSKGLSK